MRLHRSMPVLTVALALAGVAAPVANASQAMAPGGGTGQPTTLVQHHSASSMDSVIGLGAATGIAVVATGAAVGLRHRRRTVARHTQPANQ